jgi:cellulose synthase/poly-beta-1,6-N-acetylglucosamine synthase-like glycosyltransferase
VLLFGLLSLSLVFGLLSVHPFLSYPASLRLLRNIRGVTNRAPAAGIPSEFSVAVCVCAYNEEKSIVEKAINMIEMAAGNDRVELLVYVDGAGDRTAEMLAPFADRIRVVSSDVRRGKSYGMNVLVAQTSADIILFTDANVHIAPDALQKMLPWFADPTVACVCGHLVYTNPDDSAMSSSGSLYWRLEEGIKQLESDVYSVIGADGSLFAIRRSAHVEVPPDIIDDFYVSLRIVLSGLKAVREPRALAYERSATSTQDEFRRKVRIACQAFNVHRLLWPQLRKSPMLAYCYVSHRLMKWVIAYNLLLAAIFFLAAMCVVFPVANVLALAVAVLGVFIGLVGMGNKMALKLLAMGLSFVGAGWGVWRSIRGDRFQMWTPTPSARADT